MPKSKPFEGLRKSIRNLRFKIDQWKYKGDSVQCSICNSTYKVFAPFGVTKRKNARCLNCSSLERHRFLWSYLLEKTNLMSGQRIKLLHFAPEKIFYDIFANHPSIDYYPVDLFPECYPYTPVTVQKADITSIPFEADSFDVVITCHVLEHIPDDNLAMRELRRVLKSSGWAILQVPIDYSRKVTYEDFSITDPKERKKAFGRMSHLRVYGEDYKDKLKTAGFCVNEIDYIKQFTSQDVFKHGFNCLERIYYCTKGS